MTCTSKRVLLRSNPTCNMRTGPPSVTLAGSHRKSDPGGGPRLHGIHWRAGCPEIGHVRFGKGPSEKGQATGTSSAAYFTSRRDLWEPGAEMPPATPPWASEVSVGTSSEPGR